MIRCRLYLHTYSTILRICLITYLIKASTMTFTRIKLLLHYFYITHEYYHWRQYKFMCIFTKMRIMLMYWKYKLMKTDHNRLCNCSYDVIDRNQVDCFSVFVCMYVYVSANAWLRIAFLYDFCIYDNGFNDEHLTRTVMCFHL